MGEQNEILNILEKSEEKTTKKRTKNTEKTKKVRKLTKKELQILEIEKSLVLPDNYILINTPELLERFVNYYKRYKEEYGDEAYVFLDTETYGLDNWRDGLISISVGFMSEYYFNIPMRPFKHELSKDVPTLPFDMVADALRPLLENDYQIVMANAKYDIHTLYNWANIDITFNIYWDTVIAGGLLDENKPKGLKEWYLNYTLPWLIEQGKVPRDELNRPTFKFSSLFDNIPFDEVPHRLATYYACHDVFMTHWVFLYQKQVFENPAFKLDKVYKLFREVEMPLIPVFTIAERRGVRLDSKFLTEVVGKVLRDKLEEIKKEIHSILGGTITLTKTRTRQKKGVKFKEQYEVVEEFNIGSPSQVAYKLYDEHKILEPEVTYDKTTRKEVVKKSTSRKVLTRNKKKHNVIELILEYRGLSKLIDAFVEKLPAHAVNGVVHPSYNQLVRTGRVSCSNPNLNRRAA